MLNHRENHKNKKITTFAAITQDFEEFMNWTFHSVVFIAEIPWIYLIEQIILNHVCSLTESIILAPETNPYLGNLMPIFFLHQCAAESIFQANKLLAHYYQFYFPNYKLIWTEPEWIIH